MKGDPRVCAALGQIAALQDRLEKSCATPVTVRTFFSEQIRAVVREVKSRGGISKAASGANMVNSAVVKSVGVPKSFAAALACESQTAHITLEHFTAAGRLSVLRLLRGFSLSMGAGDMLVPLILLRSVTEHIAITHSVVGFVSDQPESKDFDSARGTLAKITERLNKLAYGTRISWRKIQSKDSGWPLRKKDIKYTNDDEWANDLEAENILDAIDKLDKQVPGTRAVYEVLCEFAHPNIGTVFVPTTSRRPIIDQNGVYWLEFRLTSGPPESFLTATGELLPRVLQTCAACLDSYEAMQAAADRAKQKTQRMAQTIIRHNVAKKRAAFRPYEPCPCGSQEKFRFCCGAPEARN
jgi:hypothetical protein